MAATRQKYSRRQLETLWVRAGGDPKVAPAMAAVAMAESGGDPSAYNESGATGLWQILGGVVPGNLRDPLVNAKNAVKKYEDAGSGGGDPLSPWYASKATWSKDPKFKKVQKEVIEGDTEKALKFSPAGVPVQEGVESTADALKAVGEFFGTLGKFILSPEGWLQIGQVFGGIILIGWGASVLVRATTNVNPPRLGKYAKLAVTKGLAP